MDTRTIQNQLAQFRTALTQRINIDDLIVFGSYADGIATEDSDIDVIVIAEAFDGLTEDDRLRLLDEAAENITPPIEAWGFTRGEVDEAGDLTTLGYARDQGY